MLPLRFKLVFSYNENTDSKVKKDNLTDLISDLTKPVESKPSDNKPVVEPPKDLDDYQVITPDGETITLNMTRVEKGSKRDRLLTKCESLVLQGTDSPTDIADALNIFFNTAKTYIRLIRERWVDSSGVDELQTKRQELIKKTEAIIRESWQLKNKAKNTLEAVGALRTALMAIERLEKLQGIDSLPLPVEKPQEIQLFELAQEVIALPKMRKRS